jgi:hypothetical protein
MGLGITCGAVARAWEPESDVWFEVQFYASNCMVYGDLLNLSQCLFLDL